MDEMTRLRDLRADTPTPDRSRLAAGRAALLDAAGNQRFVHVRARRRLAVLGAAAATVVAALTATQLSGGGDGNVLPSATQSERAPAPDAATVLRKAARAAEGRPDPTPRTGQWVYVKRVQGPADAPGDEPSTPARKEENWWKFGALEDGWRDEDGVLSPREAYTVLDELPAEPEQVFAEALKWYPPRDTDDMREARFDAAEYLLKMPFAPPEGRAKVYRALAELDGVRVLDHLVTGPTGEKALALHYDGDRATRDEILIDPQTYRLAGFRSVQVEDPEPFPDQPGLPRFEAGDVVSHMTIVDVAVVGREEERP